MESKKPSILVGTPAYNGQITTAYFQSVLNLVQKCHKEDININFVVLDKESLITRARNVVVSSFLKSDFTHLLFVDADIGFHPGCIDRMLAFDKDIVAGVYPQKIIDWGRLFHACDAGIDKKELPYYSLRYNLGFEDHTKVEIQGGFAVAKNAATGFMMIKRCVFEQMKEKYPELLVKSELGEYHAFFDTMIDPDDQTYLSEDYAFCRRWQKIGGKVYIDLVSPFSHTGMHAFIGDIKTQFKLPMNPEKEDDKGKGEDKK
jgi:glycosyltransferase involved in cell wall biosynthesis